MATAPVTAADAQKLVGELNAERIHWPTKITMITAALRRCLAPPSAHVEDTCATTHVGDLQRYLALRPDQGASDVRRRGVADRHLRGVVHQEHGRADDLLRCARAAERAHAVSAPARWHLVRLEMGRRAEAWDHARSRRLDAGGAVPARRLVQGVDA